jgi:hypothetical protein
MIDPATRWFEVYRIDGPPTAQKTMEAFDNTWLCRYPRPQYVGIDNGSEFKAEFRALCKNFGLIPKPITAHNPQGNSTIEKVHATLGNILRTFELENQDLNDNDPWTTFLNSAAWALRSTYHTVLNATPGQVVFGRDMLLPIQYKVDWAQVVQKKHDQVHKDNKRENNQRVPYEYKVGDRVLLSKPGTLPKMVTPREGPYEVLNVYTNGTVRIARGPVSTRVNIRRLRPYFDSTDSGGE